MTDEMPNVMIDLETMSTANNAAIVSIGAVEFDPETNSLGRTFYRRIDLASSESFGLKIDPGTILWWLKQSDKAREELTKADSLTLDQALNDFAKWVPDKMTPWGNAASFDLTILTNAYKAVDRGTPWKYHNERCYRTIKVLHPNIKIERDGIHHNALDDAISQANHLMDILKVMAPAKHILCLEEI
jgi:hypothetical protein